MPPTRNIEVVATAGDLFHAAAEEFMSVARAAIGAQGRFTVALSGGSTPKALYSLLATNYADFVWNRVFLFFGDERHVPPNDPESNYRMVNEALLTKISIPAENVFRVPAENPDADVAAFEYEAQLRRFFELKAGEVPRFDLILLGMGPDGHTASLFPDSAALDEQSRDRARLVERPAGADANAANVAIDAIENQLDQTRALGLALQQHDEIVGESGERRHNRVDMGDRAGETTLGGKIRRGETRRDRIACEAVQCIELCQNLGAETR